MPNKQTKKKRINKAFGIKRIRIVLNTNVPNDKEFDVTSNIFHFKNIKISSGYPLFSDRFEYDESVLNEICSNNYSEKVALFFDKIRFKIFMSRCKQLDTKQVYEKDGPVDKNIMIML